MVPFEAGCVKVGHTTNCYRMSVSKSPLTLDIFMTFEWVALTGW